MLIFENKKYCFGCSLCKEACPSKAIVMESDKDGFLYPNIDISKCIDCGLCKQRCIYHSKIDEKKAECFAVKHQNLEVRLSSSSGGFFWAMVETVINNNGVVFGVKYDENWNVVYDYAEDLQKAKAFKVSKYVQASIEKVYDQIYEFCENGRLVLFVGTPCQVDAVRSKFAHKYSNIILCDLLCRSIASPLIWSDYISFLKGKNKKIENINSRSKDNGWKNSCYKILCAGNVKLSFKYSSIFSSIFGSKLSIRPSCTACKYRRYDRVGDITMGDFWGIEKICPSFYDDIGISFVKLSTNKGECFFKGIECITKIEVNEDECRAKLHFNTFKDNSESFLKDYHSKGFEYVAKKYTYFGGLRRFRKFIKQIKIKIFN